MWKRHWLSPLKVAASTSSSWMRSQMLQIWWICLCTSGMNMPAQLKRNFCSVDHWRPGPQQSTYSLPDTFVKENGLNRSKCVEVCTGGARAMTGCHSGTAARICKMQMQCSIDAMDSLRHTSGGTGSEEVARHFEVCAELLCENCELH